MMIRFILIILIFCSCANSKVIEIPTEKPVDTAKIIFLNYSISKNPDDLLVIKFVDQIIADGMLKVNSSAAFNLRNEDFKLIQMDQNQRSLDSVFIENPLTKTVEFLNEAGQFEKRTINLDSAKFSIRMQLNTKTKTIKIYRHNNSTQPLIEHSL